MKVRQRLTAVLLTAALACCQTLPALASGAAPGDINADGAVNAADALLALQHSVRLIALEQDRLAAADVNGDGAVNAADALLILQYSVRLIAGFPPAAQTVPWTDGATAYAQTFSAVPTGPIRTLYQQAGRYDGTMDIPADSVMVYVSSIREVEGVFASWRESERPDRQIDAMIPGGRDIGFEYFSLFPERGKKDAQRARGSGPDDGPYLYHANNTDVHYMMPTTYYTEYKWMLVDAVCRQGVRIVAIEEPEFWYIGCFNDGFYEEWENYYGTPFVDPFSSAEARYKAARLMAYMWTRMYEVIGARMAENYPDVQLAVAAHSVPSYNSGIVSTQNSVAALPTVPIYIGQTWSDTVSWPFTYGGQEVSMPFEKGFFEYGSYADSMGEDTTLYTLVDAKADNGDLTWDRYEYLWQETVAAELMQGDVRHFQPCVWPSRGFSVAPDRYKTVQLAVNNVLRQVGAQPAALYAGTPGIRLGVSDTVTYPYYFMFTPTTNPGLDAAAVSLIERGIPLTALSLDRLTDADDLQGVGLLILSWDIQKPLNEQVNAAIAEWVKNGGVLLYIGGYNDYDTVPGEWWTAKGQTPLENLLFHLGLNGLRPAPMEILFSYYDWVGPAGYGRHFAQGDYLTAEMSYSLAFTGTGFTPLIRNDDAVFGVEAAVGRGHVVAVGLPSAAFGQSAKGPDQLRDLVAYACRYTPAPYCETDLMLMQRGPFVAAHALGAERTLTGAFIDLFHEELPVVFRKTLAAGQSALLYDLTAVRTAGTPALAFTGGDLRGEPVQTADTTVFTIGGPTGAQSATRLLGNGRYPRQIDAAVAGGRTGNFIARWDNATGSLLLQCPHTADAPVTFTVTWGDTPVPTTPAYAWRTTAYTAGSREADAVYLLRATGQAFTAHRVMTGEAETVYRFDLKKTGDMHAEVTVHGNYRIQASADGEHYVTVYDYGAVGDTPADSADNKTSLTVFPADCGATDQFYLRVCCCDPQDAYGCYLSRLTVRQKVAAP